MEDMKVCVYCQKQSKLSREHCISLSVLKELFGRSNTNTAFTKKQGKWKTILGHEEIIKDVCEECNSKLSIKGYDAAGVQLVKDINRSHTSSVLQMTFAKETMAWLLKTHLNLIRQKHKELSTILKLSPYFYQNLLNGNITKLKDFRMFFQVIDLKPEIWQRVSMMYNVVDIINVPGSIFCSHVRIKYVDTFLVLPSEDTYNEFDQKVDQAVLAMQVLKDNRWLIEMNTKSVSSKRKLILAKTFPERKFHEGLISLTEYQKLHPDSNND